MRLRPAQPADIDALARIAAAAYRTSFAAILEAAALAARDEPFFAAHFVAMLPRVHVAEAKGRILGFTQATGAHLDMLFVAAEAQETGVGNALLRDAEARGIRTLECFAANGSARRFSMSSLVRSPVTLP